MSLFLEGARTSYEVGTNPGTYVRNSATATAGSNHVKSYSCGNILIPELHD